ncbi:hypothetical protein CPB83DRAFT_834946 [Crepidotus variabilis]|uniref:Zn(2)-C6 fungal-type domain-containing protein n=1 Tax=Crepidotus variabilis TaxID=179855 RepID=A0A9P6EH45_9AGAR|nr:hypothetical protein CPB83DRAFT_834946 [Crepidotus variabilis]
MKVLFVPQLLLCPLVHLPGLSPVPVIVSADFAYMDAGRAPLSPGGGKRRRGSSSHETLPMIPTGHQHPHQQTTSLPSIRQLHPYLPPSSSSGLPHATNEAVPYPYTGSSSYAPHNPSAESGPSHSMSAGQRENLYGGGESEAEDPEHPSPPKKKRRRQALSCTECKRRKIKCDRTHPCTPCTRRGEEAGCQWHIVEPVDKYVTKAEFDDLKIRYEQLEAHVRRFFPLGTPATSGPMHPYYPLGVPPGIASVMSEPVAMAYGSGSPTNLNYSTALMPPPQQQHYQHPPESSSQSTQHQSSRYAKVDGSSSQSSARPMGMAAAGASPNMSAMVQSPQQIPRRRDSSTSKSSPSLSSAAVKASPLSLSSITSPFQPDPSSSHSQPKNFHAQTLILGERLRPETEDPLNKFTPLAVVPPQEISALLRPPTSPPDQSVAQRSHDPSNRSIVGSGSAARDSERDRAITGPRGSRDR